MGSTCSWTKVDCTEVKFGLDIVGPDSASINKVKAGLELCVKEVQSSKLYANNG